MILAALWRDSLKTKPKLVALTVDHGLRKESKAEAAAVARLAHKLDIPHRTLRWTGRKPKTGLQESARLTRYRLLANASRKAGATHILTAHTLDDQGETVLIRMSRGSGLSGLGAMQRIAAVPQHEGFFIVRPLLEIAKARLIATLHAAGISYADDPSNRDPRFTRARLRVLMNLLAEEGLDARQLARLAGRLRRADIAIEQAADRAVADLFVELPAAPAIAIESPRFADLPAEVALRLLGRAIARVGDEGPVELGKLEALKTALDEAQTGPEHRFRRTLAGAIVTLKDPQILVERAPQRRRKVLTKRRPDRPRAAKRR
jgi:tRNA(Ile)-lysidine synthase